MCFILCSLAVVICFAVQVNSQLASKRIGEWSPDRFHMYPNPWKDAVECRTAEASGVSGLCDYNEMLTLEQRKELSGQPEMSVTAAEKGDLWKNVNGKIRIMVTVAVMKKIGPHITDYRAAAGEFAEKFRIHWNLSDCSVILVVSKGDNTSFLDSGSDVVSLLTYNVTDKIDLDMLNKFFMKGLVMEGINATLLELRSAAATVAATAPTAEQTTAQTYEFEESSGYTPIIVGVIIGVIVVLIIIIVVIIVIRAKKRAGARNTKEDEHLRGAADV